jgi:mannosyltransferase
MAAAPAVTRTSSSGDGADPPTVHVPVDRRPLVVAGVAVAVVAGVLLRLFTRSELWLDEALTVHLAQLPLGELPDALRRDGAPPLYYVVLHGWMGFFGDGNQAVRLLSAVFSVATLPLIHRAGRRLGGPTVGIAALVLVATSPFAIRYATETRMYALVALLVTAGWLALVNALERPRPLMLVAVGGVAGALLLTHYWSFYLLGTTGLALALAAWRVPARRVPALACLGAMAVGALALFGPWLPIFLYQSAHTGTPWGISPSPVEVAFTTLVDLGGGPYPEGQALAGLLAALALLALLGRAVDGRHIELDLRTRPGARRELLVAGATLIVAVAAGVLTASAFASRYTSVIFPLVLLVAAYGFRTLADRRLLSVLLAIAALLGIVGGVRNMVHRRTSADRVVELIQERGGRPGDLVVYCPDQLGPDVTRVLPDSYREATFPDGADPRIVDWVDYAERMAAADPAVFATEMLDRAAGRTIWYVWMPGYRTLDKQCEKVNNTLGNARPGNEQLLDPDTSVFERHVLWLHPAPAGP